MINGPNISQHNDNLFQSDRDLITQLNRTKVKEKYGMLGNPILSPAKILHFTINDNFAYLALSSHEAVKVDLKTNEIVMNYKGHKGPITSISTYSIGDKNFIITASWDKTLKKWCADSGNLLMTFYGHSDFVKCAKVFGAKLYSSSTDSIIGEWSLESGKCLRSFQGHRRSVEDLFITEDGKYIYSASSDNDILKWDIITGTSVQCFEGHLTSIRQDEECLWSVSADKKACKWDLETGKIDTTLEHPDYVVSIAVGGGVVVTGCRDENIRIWNPNTEKCTKIIKGHYGEVSHLVIRKNYLYSGSLDCTFRKWDLNDPMLGEAHVEIDEIVNDGVIMTAEEELELAELMG